mgnify:CR=1 FL=1
MLSTKAETFSAIKFLYTASSTAITLDIESTDWASDTTALQSDPATNNVISFSRFLSLHGSNYYSAEHFAA